MRVEFDKSFLKSLNKIKDTKALLRVEKIILDCEAASSLSEIKDIKKLHGFSDYFRIKTGNYRIGILLNKSVLRFIIIAHRKDIYKKFP